MRETGLTNRFITYLESVEDVRLKAYDSPEGGLQTIGIGHKFKDGEPQP